MDKTHVNGDDTCEIYRWLRRNSELYEKSTDQSKTIPWNYAKFLIDGQTGQVVNYAEPQTEPNALLPDIHKLLGISPNEKPSKTNPEEKLTQYFQRHPIPLDY